MKSRRSRNITASAFSTPAESALLNVRAFGPGAVGLQQPRDDKVVLGPDLAGETHVAAGRRCWQA